MRSELKEIEWVGNGGIADKTWQYLTGARYVPCDCGAELLQIQRDIELLSGDKQFTVQFYLAMYSYGGRGDGRLTWGDRL